MPLEFVHPGTECKAATIETPQNPSSEQNQCISRKLLLGTPLGANPQQSTSMGGENVKTIPPKGPPKTGQHGRVVVVVPHLLMAVVQHLLLLLFLFLLFLVLSLMQPQPHGVVVVWVLLLHLFKMPSTYTEALL